MGKRKDRSHHRVLEWLRAWRTAVFLLFALSTVAAIFLLPGTLTEQLDNALLDLHFRVRGEADKPRDIVLVGFNESTFTYYNSLDAEAVAENPTLALFRPAKDWPWDRRVHAQILDFLSDQGARAVMFDFIFTGAPETEGDFLFADAILEHRDKVVVGSAYQTFQDQRIGGAEGVAHTSLRFLTSDEYLPFEDWAGMIGYTNVLSDEDMVVRRVRFGENARHLALAEFDVDSAKERRLLEHFAKEPPDMFAIAMQTAKVANPEVDVPPLDEELIINYAGSARTFDSIPVEHLLHAGTTMHEHLVREQFFKDKVVIVGPVAEFFKDHKGTPYGIMPGPEVQANLVNTVLQGNWITTAPLYYTTLATLLMACTSLLICLRVSRALLKIGLLVVLSMGLLVLLQVSFLYGVWTPSAGSLLSLGLCGFFGVTYDFVMEQYERARVRGVLDRYVTSNVAAMVLQNRKSFEDMLRGRRQGVTTLFSDIRGFTTLSERSDPETLVDQLNEYFREMVDAVLQEDGTLQKFIGDAVMAVWGDTHTRGAGEDAIRAVRCALRMTEELKKLNAEWRQRDERIELAIGVGLNYGEAIVGNIGHPRRMEFTVLGDAVNLASRLEGATKQYGQAVLVGDSVYKLTQEAFLYRHIDRIAVKGKSSAVDVYAPLALNTGETPAWLDCHHRALAAYFAGDFAQAKAGFEETEQLLEDTDPVCRLFINRCEECLKEPPQRQWDGVYRMTSK